MSKDMSFPFEAVCEAAAAELAGNTLLCTAWPRAVAAAVADGRCKDFWEIEFQNTANSHMSKNKPPHPHTYRLIRFFFHTSCTFCRHTNIVKYSKIEAKMIK